MTSKTNMMTQDEFRERLKQIASPKDEADLCRECVDAGGTARQIARWMGWSDASVNERILFARFVRFCERESLRLPAITRAKFRALYFAKTRGRIPSRSRGDARSKRVVKDQERRFRQILAILNGECPGCREIDQRLRPLLADLRRELKKHPAMRNFVTIARIEHQVGEVLDSIEGSIAPTALQEGPAGTARNHTKENDNGMATGPSGCEEAQEKGRARAGG